jgi:hypothetical protein
MPWALRSSQPGFEILGHFASSGGTWDFKWEDDSNLLDLLPSYERLFDRMRFAAMVELVIS